MSLFLRHTTIALVMTLLVTVSLSACGKPDPAEEAAKTRYVALGDSAVAGAGIDDADPLSGACLRSDQNYPSLIAEALDVDDFVDMSCVGASSSDVVNGLEQPGIGYIPPQIDAVSKETDVVTISIGGNDAQYIPSLFLSCYIPPQSSSKNCQKTVKRLPDLLDKIESDIAGTIDDIQKRAPDAQVVMVSYLRLMPDSGTCSTVPITAKNLRDAAAAEGQLEKAMRAGTKKAGADYVDMRTLSEGHDACESDKKAWTSGIDPKKGDGTQLHPRAKGMKAVARAVEPVVQKRLGK